LSARFYVIPPGCLYTSLRGGSLYRLQAITIKAPPHPATAVSPASLFGYSF